MVREGSSKKHDALRREVETLRARFTKMSEVGRRITEDLGPRRGASGNR